ncbi:MAG: DUF302 domain-containing protein [Acidobacteria bacterium]|nr:DUF302 domain-containing protein [Acidobacteriota bacterium]
MRTKTTFLVIMILAAFVALAAPASAQQDRVVVGSEHSFEQTIKNLKSAVGQGGMMVMAEVDQGNMLKMTGLDLKATTFLVGNPTVGKMLFQRNHGVGLYVPLRIFVTEENGKTYISYEKASTQLGQFNDPEINKTAAMLDQKLEGLARMASM